MGCARDETVVSFYVLVLSMIIQVNTTKYPGNERIKLRLTRRTGFLTPTWGKGVSLDANDFQTAPHVSDTASPRGVERGVAPLP